MIVAHELVKVRMDNINNDFFILNSYLSCFIFTSISNERRRFEELLFQHFTNRLSIQFNIIAHSIPNFMYVKTFYTDLEGNLQECGDFTWRGV